MKTLRSVTCMLAIAVSPARAEPPAIKAKVEEPVLQELMGGCSLKCGFPWRAEVPSASGKKPTSANALNDERADTAWIASDTSLGVGVRLKLLFPKKLRPAEEGQIPVYGLDIINGNWKSEEEWKAHARVKRVRLYYNGTPFRDVTFTDTRRWQRVTFPDFMVSSGDSMAVEILEIYRGEEGMGAAISEIVLQGAH